VSSPREIIRPAGRSDVAELSRAFLEVFGQEREEAVWQWKYFDNPRGTYSYVCEADGRIVAHCGGTPILMSDGKDRYPALQSVDFLSTRSHAGGLGGGGVFVRTVRAFFERYCGAGKTAMVYGFPGERHRLLGERLLGYEPIEAVGELSVEPEGNETELVGFSEAYLALLSQATYEFGGLRDAEYLRWRYLAHPTHRYEIIAVRRWFRVKPELIAVVRRKVDEVVVMEIEGRWDAGLLRRLVDAFRGCGTRVRMWGSPEHPRGRRLIEAGMGLELREHQVEARFFFNRPRPRAGELYYTLGDYDVE
jgi:hypothetical protein